jgi:large subunit ribosomal protein L22
MAIDVRAKARYVPVSPFKARRVINLLRGKDADEALAMLRFMPHSAARPVYKLIASAIANAEENFGLNREDLYIYRIFADEGPTRKWRRFGARGRFKPLLKRSSHITVILREHEEE